MSTDKQTFSTNMSDLSPYILGKKFTGTCKNRVILSKEQLEDFLTRLEEDQIAKEFFQAYDLARDFYDTMVDFKHFFDSKIRDELFYAAKTKKVYRQIPAFCVYLLERAWNECYGIPNLIIKVLPTSALKKFFEEGYFTGGVTLKDAICNICCEEYQPLSIQNNKNKLHDFTEIYVESTDMVAALPHSIADDLTTSAISEIKVTSNGLETNGVLLRTMSGYVGAINSMYDLREVI